MRRFDKLLAYLDGPVVSSTDTTGYEYLEHIEEDATAGNEFLASVFQSIREDKKYVYIGAFPFHWFNKKLKKRYKTTKLEHLYRSMGIKFRGRTEIQIHKFFLSELVYLLKQFSAPKVYLDLILNSTWMKRTLETNFPNRVNLSNITKAMNVKLYDYQQEYIEQYDEQKYKGCLNGSILSLDTGLGKMQDADCKVKIPGGWARIGDLNVGDTITAWDGTAVKVNGVFPQGKKRLYRVFTLDGGYTDVGLEHLWSVVSSGFSGTHMRTFDTKQIIEKLEIGTKIEIPVCLSEMVDDIDILMDPQDLGLLYRTGLFIIPESYICGSHKTRLKLVKGILRIDELSENIYTVKSLDVAKTVQYLVRSLGGLCIISQIESGYELNVKIKDNMGTKKLYNEIVNIEPLLVEKECVCISVDHPDKLYITDDFIVTHNTTTSLALMESINTDKLIIIAPKATLIQVWEEHLLRLYKNRRSVYVVNRDPIGDYGAYIYNYESMDKIYDSMQYLKGKQVGVIVDESHNFLRIKSDRTQSLIKLRSDLNTSDMVLMSGTPVKAIGVEIMPLLRAIDGFFDDEAELIFKKAFGVNTILANDILHARLKTMMFRRVKEDVLKLPPMYEHDIKITTANGYYYTIDNIKNVLIQYGKERQEYHEFKMEEYEEQWNRCHKYLREQTKIGATQDYQRYMSIVDKLRVSGYNRYDDGLVKAVVWMNEYERKVLLLNLPRDLAKDFKACRSAIKYLPLKIQGETLGYLSYLRGRMTQELLNGLDMKDLIDSAIKKTLIFTSYVDVVETTNSRLLELGYKPVCVYGGSKDNNAEIDKFKKDGSINPMIATIQTLATGVTLTEANRVIFINRPWRNADYHQALSRTRRIGQDTEVDVFTVTLSTGDKPNLSERMQDILDWSKQMSDSIIDGTSNVVSFEELLDSSAGFMLADIY